MVQDNGPVSFFCAWLSSFPNAIFLRDSPSSIVYSQFLCHKLISHERTGLFLGSLFSTLKSALFRYNLHTMQCSHFKYCRVVREFWHAYTHLCSQSPSRYRTIIIPWSSSHCRFCAFILSSCFSAGFPFYSLLPTGVPFFGSAGQKHKISLRVLALNMAAPPCSSTTQTEER